MAKMDKKDVFIQDVRKRRAYKNRWDLYEKFGCNPYEHKDHFFSLGYSRSGPFYFTVG